MAKMRKVLGRALVEALSVQPEGMGIQDAYDAVDEQFRFPDEWYQQIPQTAGYKFLEAAGYENWRDIPQEELIQLVATEPQWQNQIRWARNDLREQGLLDANAPRGWWRLTAKGLQAAGPAKSSSLSKEEEEMLMRRPPRKRRPTSSIESGLPNLDGRRKKLLGRLANITQSMPLEDLELLVDLAFTVRRRSL